MIQEVWNALFCPYCNAIVEGNTEQEVKEELLKHQKYVQCIKGY